jgi:hypothetical protein
MTVGQISRRFHAATPPPGAARAKPAQEAAASTSRALVRIEPATRAEALSGRMERPNAAFLAQLIATRRQLAQTRQRRRAEPAEAVTAYATCAVAPIQQAPARLRSL